MAWASGGNTNTERRSFAGGGDETGAIKAGGSSDSTENYQDDSESYDGTSWSSEGTITPSIRHNWGGGDDSDGIWATGYTGSASNKCQEWNGTTWSDGGNCSTSVRLGQGGGASSSDAIKVSGYNTASCEEYNGTSWSSGGSLNTKTWRGGASGNVTDAIKMGGENCDAGEVETYNGTTWTDESNNLSENRTLPASSGDGSDGGARGGYTASDSYADSTEDWNGTSWSSGDSLSLGRTDCGNGSQGGGASNGIVMGGNSASNTGTLTTEELAGSAPAGTNMSINIGDTFKDVDSLKINVGDDWKDVVSVSQNVGDSWKTVF